MCTIGGIVCWFQLMEPTQKQISEDLPMVRNRMSVTCLNGKSCVWALRVRLQLPLLRS